MALLLLLVMTAFPLLTPHGGGSNAAAALRSIAEQSAQSGDLQNIAAISAQRGNDAAWDIWLSITVIGVLLILAVIQIHSLSKAMLQPFVQMLAVLSRDCPHVLDSIHLPKV